MIIPGILISLITFPGIIMHEWAHKKFCDFFGVKVKKVCYFRLKNPVGFVVHERPSKYRHIFGISVGPFVVNTFFSLFFLALFFMTSGIISTIVIWLGISAAMNAFPSSGDAKMLWKGTKQHSKKKKSVLLGFPVAAVIYVANILRIVWFDLIYAVGLYLLVSGLI